MQRGCGLKVEVALVTNEAISLRATLYRVAPSTAQRKRLSSLLRTI
jgi:hypothetical protein